MIFSFSLSSFVSFTLAPFIYLFIISCFLSYTFLSLYFSIPFFLFYSSFPRLVISLPSSFLFLSLFCRSLFLSYTFFLSPCSRFPLSTRLFSFHRPFVFSFISFIFLLFSFLIIHLFNPSSFSSLYSFSYSSSSSPFIIPSFISAFLCYSLLLPLLLYPFPTPSLSTIVVFFFITVPFLYSLLYQYILSVTPRSSGKVGICVGRGDGAVRGG